MKTSNRIAVLFIVMFVAFFSIGCAKKKSSNGGVRTAQAATNTDTSTPTTGDGEGEGENTTGTVSCQASCADGQVEVTSQGQKFCLPKNVCSECYGYYKGYCYQGTNAYQYYYGTN
jgi:hypothetical protein